MRKRIVFAFIVAWIVSIGIMAANADVDTGSLTTNEYFWKLGQEDKGAIPHAKFTGALNKADRAIHQGLILSNRLEYPGTNDSVTLGRATSSMKINSVDAVLQADANENVTINIAHGTDRSGAGTDLFSSDETVTDTTTGQTITCDGDSTIDTNEWVWAKITGGCGNVEELFFIIDPSVS